MIEKRSQYRHRERGRKHRREGTRGRSTRVFCALVGAILISGGILGNVLAKTPLFSQRKTSRIAAQATGELKVHFLDVGQADCVLIQANGHNMLVDAGTNAAADTVVTYLENQGVKTLDYVIGTHPHEDHIGGMDTVLDCFEVGEVFMPEQPTTTKSYEDVLDAVERKGLAITTPTFEMTRNLGTSKFIFVTPDPEGDYEDLNDCSVGIQITNGTHSFLMCGDASSQIEEKMIHSDIYLKSDVIKLSHHGSSDANSEAFLRAVDPKYAVVSCGENNDYGHPHREVLEELRRMNIDIYRTDQQGTIVFASDGNTLTCNVKPYEMTGGISDVYHRSF